MSWELGGWAGERTQSFHRWPREWRALEQGECLWSEYSLLYFFNRSIVDIQYYVSFRCTKQQVTIFKDHIPFIVIIKHWLNILCCTICLYSLFILYIVVCTSYSLTLILPWLPLVCSLWVCYCFVSCIFLISFIISHISDIIQSFVFLCLTWFT